MAIVKNAKGQSKGPDASEYKINEMERAVTADNEAWRGIREQIDEKGKRGTRGWRRGPSRWCRASCPCTLEIQAYTVSAKVLASLISSRSIRGIIDACY